MSHYFESKQHSDEKQISFNAELFGQTFTFFCSSGMFSVGKLDLGAQILTTYADIKANDTVLDLGCSYGVVGIAIAKHYGVQTFLVDINERAVSYAKKNIEKNNVSQKSIAIVSDGFQKLKDKTFSVILFNPPQHAGKQLCLDLIKESKEHLTQGGSLQVVCRHNRGGASFEKYMQELFGNVEPLKRKSGYRVYKSIKN